MVTVMPHHYHPRTPVHDPRQRVLYVPFVRPEYGTCPDCGAEQDRFCDADCEMTDPLRREWWVGLRRCLRCERKDDNPGDAIVVVLPKSPVLHLLRDLDGTRCGLVDPSRAHVYRRRW